MFLPRETLTKFQISVSLSCQLSQVSQFKPSGCLVKQKCFHRLSSSNSRRERRNCLGYTERPLTNGITAPSTRFLRVQSNSSLNCSAQEMAVTESHRDSSSISVTDTISVRPDASLESFLRIVPRVSLLTSFIDGVPNGSIPSSRVATDESTRH